MNYLSNKVNVSPVLSLYLVSFDDWGYDEFDAFLVVAYSEEEADMLTPDQDMNYHIGTGMGYDCPKPDPEIIRLYRDSCGTGRSIRRIGDAWAELEWGDVPISSYNPG
jgi:hypothetical protein